MSSNQAFRALADETDHDANKHDRHALTEHHVQHVEPVRTDRDANANLVRPLRHPVRDDPVDSDRSKHQRDARKQREQGHDQLTLDLRLAARG